MMRRLQQLVVICSVAGLLTACIPSLESGDQSQLSLLDVTRDSVPELDPGVLTGQLQNGFRYYLRSTNSSLRNDQLEVRLIVKAGSLYERPDQHGYAHLLEHMAYRGTTSFPANDIESLLTRNGLRWGADVNATTHYGATVYRFSLTQKDTHLLPEILELMTEWLDSVEFDPAALENEKRIVDAELRERYADRNHIIDPVTKSAYAGSRYANQHPAGDINNIHNATVDDLKKFWKSHYRADNAALVITGSTRPWQLEPLIVSHFSRLEVQPRQITDSELQAESSNARPGVMFLKDGATVELQSYSNPTLEIPQLSVNFISRLPESAGSLSAATKAFENRFLNQLLFNVYSYLLRDRIDNKPECSTVTLEASLLESMQMVEHVRLSVTEKNLVPCLVTAYYAVDAVNDTILTVEEFEEFRQLFDEIKEVSISQYRSRNAAVIADGLVDMVTNGEYLLSSWDMQSILQRVIDDLDREKLNQLIADVRNSHLLVYSLVTNKPVPPAMTDLVAAISDGSPTISSRRPVSSVVYGDLRDDQSDMVVPLSDSPANLKFSTEPAGSLSKLLPASATEAAGEIYYEWQLDNGSTVLLLPDDRFDHVAVAAISKGGYARRSGRSAIAAKSLPEFLSVNGLDGYTSLSLRKVMQDKRLRVMPFVDLLHHGINASGHTADLPVLLTIVNSYFQKPLVLEPQSSVFLQQLNKSNYGAQWQNSLWRESSPGQSQGDSLLAKQDFVTAHQELFSNTADFDFIFVGSVDPDELQRQLVRISTNGGKRQSKNLKIGETQSVKAEVANPVAINHGANNTEVSLLFTCQNTFANETGRSRSNVLQQWRLLSDVVAERLRHSLREELGMVYEIESDIPVSDQLMHQIDFSVAPADEVRATAATYSVLSEISSKGISESELKGALARDIRRANQVGSDYQSIADARAQQLLFSGSSKPAVSSLPALGEINRLARCINSSERQVTLDSLETFRPEILENESNRHESAYQQQIPRRLR